MKIVKFKDGTYGVRRLTLFGYEYKDFRSIEFWWSRNSQYFPACHGTLTEAEYYTEYYTDKGKVVK